jgi:hypothetical protein
MPLHPFPAPASGVATGHPGGGAVLAIRFHTTVLFSGPGYGMSELGTQFMRVHGREPFPPWPSEGVPATKADLSASSVVSSAQLEGGMPRDGRRRPFLAHL